MNNIKEEIIKAETNFALMVKEQGVAKSFKYYAADDAVISRNNSIIKGKDEIFNYYISNKIYDNCQLQWKPSFIDVSSQGDMAYTYGNYVFKYTNENNDTITNTGIFHTVWKKQTDGSWKFVWD